MADNKKEQQRAELHRTIWGIANDLRGSVDGWDFNLFFGTTIATCILVLRKSKSENSTLFIDATREFVKVTNSNKLTQDNIEKILALYASREQTQYMSKLVPNAEIAEQEYNLSVNTYVEQEDKREAIDIIALNAEIERIVAREDVLRREINKIVAEIEGQVS